MNSTNHTLSNLFDYKLKLVEQIVLASIFISALIGNILVLGIMLNKRQRCMPRMAFYILHLTIADLLVAFFSVLPMFIWKSTITFVGGDLLCRIVAFLMLTVSYISVYTLVVMAYDRYRAIVHPLSIYSWTLRSGQRQMLCVWILSLLLSSPQLFIFRLDHHPAYEKKTCLAKFFGSNRTWELIYIAWTNAFQFFLPMCILIYYYSSVYSIINQHFSMYRTSMNSKTTNLSNLLTSNPTKSSAVLNGKTNSYSKEQMPIDMMYPIVYRLRRTQFELPKNASVNSMNAGKARQRCGANHFLSRARLKTIKLTFIVVLTYILCSTPFYIGSIIMVLHGKFISQKTMNWLMTIFSLLFNLNSCSNPIICLTLSGTLRFQNDQPHRAILLLQAKQLNYKTRRARFPRVFESM